MSVLRGDSGCSIAVFSRTMISKVWVLATLISLGANTDLCPSHCTCHGTNAECSAVPDIKLPDSIQTFKMTADIPVLTHNTVSMMGDMLLALDLSNCCIRTIEPHAFQSKKELTVLNLQGNNLHQFPLELLQHNAKLEKLQIADNVLEEIPDSALQNCHSLQELDLQLNRLRKIPSHLPPSLQILDASHNNIDVHPTHLSKIGLQYLDLTNNPLRLSAASNIFKIQSLEALCIEHHHTSLPSALGTNLPKLQLLSLQGRNDTEKTALDADALTSIGTIEHLRVLSLENYVLESLLFLQNLKELHTLEIHYSDLMLPAGETVICRAEPNLEHLSTLSLKGSSRLVPALLGDPQFVSRMQELNFLTLRDTGILSLPERHVPDSVFFIDIGKNPLRCDCTLAWLKYKKENNFDSFFLTEDAACTVEHPHIKRHTRRSHGARRQHRQKRQHVKGQHATKPLMKYFEGLECDDDSIESGHLEQVFTDDHPKMTSGDVEYDSYIDMHENNMLIYIVLISVLVILLAVGIVLALVLCLYKKKKKEMKVLPEETCAAPVGEHRKSCTTTIFVKR